jgi:cell division protein FtsW
MEISVRSFKECTFDPLLLGAVLTLLATGIVMVASASLTIADKQFGQPLFFLVRQLIFVSIGLGVVYFTVRIPLDWWEQRRTALLGLALILLVLVLIPGIGHEVNGSQRWLRVGPVGIQATELAKLAVINFMAGFLVKHHRSVQYTFSGFLRPLIIVGMVSVLILAEPDFGSVVVLGSTVLGMAFLAGARLRHFIVMASLVLAAFIALAVSSPYRWERLTTFMNPWADQFDSGYQLTQALIAFGRGSWTGVGLGAGLQKWFYLPEAHTDFVFAVIGEEFGLLGVVAVVAMYGVLVGRGFFIGRKAYENQQLFASFLAYGLSLWLALQAVVCMGVNIGLLPTKGITLPLVSYGGSSLVITLIAAGLLLRIHMELDEA